MSSMAQTKNMLKFYNLIRRKFTSHHSFSFIWFKFNFYHSFVGWAPDFLWHFSLSNNLIKWIGKIHFFKIFCNLSLFVIFLLLQFCKFFHFLVPTEKLKLPKKWQLWIMTTRKASSILQCLHSDKVGLLNSKLPPFKQRASCPHLNSSSKSKLLVVFTTICLKGQFW